MFSCGTITISRQAPAELLALGVGLDHRREVGAAVGEQVLDAARGEQAEPGVGGGFGALKVTGMVGFHGADLTARQLGSKRRIVKLSLTALSLQP